METSSYEVKWPADFDEQSWLIESKGWFRGVEIHMSGKILRPIFYSPERLSQDVAIELADGRVFAEPCVIVVTSVTQACIEQAIANLANSKELERLFNAVGGPAAASARRTDG